jgi:hypothetical protein
MEGPTGKAAKGTGDCQCHRHPDPCRYQRSCPGEADEARPVLRGGTTSGIAGRETSRRLSAKLMFSLAGSTPFRDGIGRRTLSRIETCRICLSSLTCCRSSPKFIPLQLLSHGPFRAHVIHLAKRIEKLLPKFLYQSSSDDFAVGYCFWSSLL